MQLFTQLQTLGKALMLPIAVLPVAGLMLRLGAPDIFNVPFIEMAGATIFTHLPLLFAAGIAVGLSKDNAGASALAGIVGYLVLTASSTAIDSTIDMGVLAGILTGLIAGGLYNRFHNIRLPDYLGFFGGNRFVPIITGVTCLILAFIVGLIWPPIQNAIHAGGEWIVASGPIGSFAYGTANRLLIPTGLHQVLNSLSWFVLGTFETAGDLVTGDLHRYFAGDPTAGSFMVGFYPVMMFGLPAACLAVIHTAKPENRKLITGVMVSVALTSFLTGITEPVEFTFMFLAPMLYVIHALLTGISMAVMAILGVKHGFTFSAGAIDYILNYGLATRGWLVVPVGLCYAALYYGLFRFAIVKFNIQTPGRAEMDQPLAKPINVIPGMDEDTVLAHQYLTALGGIANIKTLEACITRLRLNLYERDNVNDATLMSLGAKGVLRAGTHSMQVVVGTHAENIAASMKKLIQHPTTAPIIQPSSQTSEVTEPPSESIPPLSRDTKQQAQYLLQALGGKSNIKSLSACAQTRLRVELNHTAHVDDTALTHAGVHARLLKDHVQHLIVGLSAGALASQLHDLLGSKNTNDIQEQYSVT